MAEVNQYCTFFLAGHYFGLDVLQVQEIIRYQEMTRVPLAPKVVCGLINLRGQIVTAIDLRRRLEAPR
jgi:purine-binding chemotaxis protein CheW